MYLVSCIQQALLLINSRNEELKKIRNGSITSKKVEQCVSVCVNITNIALCVPILLLCMMVSVLL